MNKVILMGRLTRDPEIRYSQSDPTLAIARYTLAVNRRISNGEEQNADFIRCVVFKKGAEFAEKYFRQGMRVLICGRLQIGSYTNKDGQKVYISEVVVDEQDFADSKKSNSSVSQTDENGFMNIPEGIDDELPFN